MPFLSDLVDRDPADGDECASCGRDFGDHATDYDYSPIELVCPNDWCWECDRRMERCRCEDVDYSEDDEYDDGEMPRPIDPIVQRARDHGIFPVTGSAPRTLATAQGLMFGVEIEVASHHVEACTRILNDAGIMARDERYNHHRREWWKVVTDASVPGCEVVSPPLPAGEMGERAVTEAMRALRRGGVTVNATCGLHVHFDAAPLGAAWVADYATVYERGARVTDSFLPRSRRDCGFARHYEERDYLNLATLRDSGAMPNIDRYKTVNTHALFVHGTVEARQHQGTLSAEKALAWIELNRALIAVAGEHGRDGAGTYSTTDSRRAVRALGNYGLSQDRGGYLVERAQELAE